MKSSSHHKRPLALAWLLLVWLVAAVRGPAGAQETTRVYLSPADPTLAVGQSTTLTIQVAGAADLYGVELHLAYDPAVMEILDADTSRTGIQLRPGDLLDPGAGFMVINSADNQAGELDYAITLLAPAEAVSGDGLLASLDVRALADGSSQLALSAILASAEGVSLPVTVEGGRLTVGSGVGTNPSAPATATPRPGTTTMPATATATPSRAPTATSRAAGESPGQPTGRAPSVTPTASQANPTAVQTAEATDGPPTSSALTAGAPTVGEATEKAQSEPTVTAGASAGAADPPANDETADLRPTSAAVPIAPSSSESPAEAEPDDNSALAGGLVLAAFVLLALVIFFGRRLLGRKL